RRRIDSSKPIYRQNRCCKNGSDHRFVFQADPYQNLLTLAEMFLVGLITSAARIRSGGLLLPVLLHMEATALGLLLG
ncbi:hypothetical protein ACR2XD_23765, partial [Klebsiella pneumoniae]